MQRALLPVFNPANYFEVREALIEAGHGDLIGGCEGLISAQPPKEAIEKRRGGEPGGIRRPLPRRGEPGDGRAARGAQPAKQGLPPGA
jgi:hypothetical protein